MEIKIMAGKSRVFTSRTKIIKSTAKIKERLDFTHKSTTIKLILMNSSNLKLKMMPCLSSKADYSPMSSYQIMWIIRKDSYSGIGSQDLLI